MGLCLQLEQKQIPPPYRPRLESERDLANFPPEFTDEPVQLTPDDQYGFLFLFFIKFIYSEKATNFCEISTIDLSYVVTVKSTMEILQKFLALSEFMNFNCLK